MILLNKSGVTNVDFTLSELVTLTGSSVYFLFNLKSDDSQANYFFTAPDISTNPIRYNRFAITLTGTAYQNLTAGTVNLPYTGFYTYKVYQQTGQTNTSLSGVTGDPIEYGKVYVSGDTTNRITYQYTGSTSLYINNF